MDLERLSPQQFNQFREFIYLKCGVRIDEKKVTMLSNRVRGRLRAGQFEDFDTYYRYLTSARGAAELEHFLDAVTTHETSFFRTPKQFEWLRNGFIEGIVERQRSGSKTPELKIWSAACASGAEAYSMAICLSENRFRLRDWRLDILGTDVSQEMLNAARSGIFKSRMMDSVLPAMRRRHFKQVEDDVWQVRSELTKFVSFKQHNLMLPPPGKDFDCIFCCNVLIYFDLKSKQVVVDHLVSALAAGGYLVLGPSEGVHDMLGPLEKTSPLIYRKPDTAALPSRSLPGQSKPRVPKSSRGVAPP